ncbi:hypothetical protein [Pyrobaculum aerophilum]|uniref:Uncharacterized protein n=1 Tax=Pyrobaculum aerophilum TaxID=13773 RepID=A0A371QXZ7_9CREN|nr:hypothetical protein [Pyrobaculum aerophilum]RFA95560.1 hypothetical protein CGL52_12695 [Pyrobaculum aerophilum]RFA98282.1 hypothetical protein CGL51_00955 [Pyrobaculum aerophilum]
MEYFAALKSLLKGDISFSVDKGELKYRGRRVVAVPADLIPLLLGELEKLFGEASSVVLESIGHAIAAAMREVLGWKTGEDALNNLPDVAKLAGYGIVKRKDNTLYFQNLPIVLNQKIISNVHGFLKGLCLEPIEIKYELNNLEVKVKTIC